MNIFKKIGGYIAIGAGTVGIAIGGWTGLQFGHEIKGNLPNMHRVHEPAGIVAVVGDPGLLGPQRDAILKDLVKLCLEAQERGLNFNTVHNGDLEYPKGTTNHRGHDIYIRPLWPMCPAHRYAFLQLGNHGLLAMNEQDYMAKRYHGRPVRPGINMMNYYAAVEFNDRFMLFNESTVWDAIVDPPIEKRMEAFDRWFLSQAKGKPIDYFAHHPFYTPSKRRPTDDYMDFWEETLKGRVDNVLAAHDHLVWEKMIDGTYHAVSGMGGKRTSGPLGYVYSDPFKHPRHSYFIRLVNGPTVTANENED